MYFLASWFWNVVNQIYLNKCLFEILFSEVIQNIISNCWKNSKILEWLHEYLTKLDPQNAFLSLIYCLSIPSPPISDPGGPLRGNKVFILLLTALLFHIKSESCSTSCNKHVPLFHFIWQWREYKRTNFPYLSISSSWREGNLCGWSTSAFITSGGTKVLLSWNNSSFMFSKCYTEKTSVPERVIWTNDILFWKISETAYIALLPEETNIFSFEMHIRDFDFSLVLWVGIFLSVCLQVVSLEFFTIIIPGLAQEKAKVSHVT